MYKKNVGLIGTGKWGKILEEKLKKNSNLIFSANSKFNYLKKIKKVNWVFVATPDKTHYKIVKKLLFLRKNVFCEKPLTLNYKKSKFLFDLAKKQKVYLYVDDIQMYHHKKINFLKKNLIIRKKLGQGKAIDLLYRFAYHDFYYLSRFIKNKKIKSINIKDKKFDLKFDIIFNTNDVCKFDYSLRSKIKIHKINNINLITKKDLLTKMIKKVLNYNVDFNKNMEISLLSNKLIDKVFDRIK